ncbi:MAG: 3-oxoacyl-ACP reductase [Deltaproteobacteria bacterium]|nr:MAG: 3-oxoacyl-ACP reductase [Deltaproteobacteria bacterium]
MELKDRVAIITGAGRGIGREIAVKLANEGADIAIFELDKNSSIEAAKEISDLGRKALPVVVDVSNTKDVQEAVEKVYNFFGRLDILVNNAGITRDKLILRMQEIDWDLVLNVNLKSVFNCTKAAIRFMTKARWGRIVNISSIVGEMGNPGQVSYAASKAGIIGFTKTVAKEVAKRGITVNAVAPGFIDTPMTRALPEKTQAMLFDLIPLKRFGTPKDVAEAVFFLCSEKAEYITGQVINVNGGMYM